MALRGGQMLWYLQQYIRWTQRMASCLVAVCLTLYLERHTKPLTVASCVWVRVCKSSRARFMLLRSYWCALSVLLGGRAVHGRDLPASAYRDVRTGRHPVHFRHCHLTSGTVLYCCCVSNGLSYSSTTQQSWRIFDSSSVPLLLCGGTTAYICKVNVYLCCLGVMVM